MLHSFLVIIQIVSAACIIALVLVQRGKGADAGAGFGAGASGTVFGARGATTALSRATAVLAVVFMLTSLSLSYLVTRGSADQGESVLEQLAGQADQSVLVPVPVPAADAVPVPAPEPAEAPPVVPAN